MSDPFADIRPYRDIEVSAVLARLLRDPEFADAIASLRLGRAAALAPALVRPLVQFMLRREVRGVTDVYTMQMVIKRYMDRMIESTTSGFSSSGLDQLDQGRAHLFMSNHRDIAMDPAFTNYALHREGRDTVRIAIGDNLLTKPWVSDLMRLNKSFIVKRSVSGPRELLAASRNLSAYIRHSLLEAMSRDKREQSFGEHIGSLAIVPVAISYELDPCDALKARELHERASTGHYKKGEQEDVASIGQGIMGDKARVHVSFGRPLGSDLETPEQVAAEIDRQVIRAYCLHPTNLYAYRMLHGENVEIPETLYFEPGDCSREQFEARIEALPEAHRPYALANYANAVASKLRLLEGAGTPC